MDVIKCYEKNQKHPFKILISLYKGTYDELMKLGKEFYNLKKQQM